MLIAVRGWTDIHPPWTLILAILTVEVVVRFAPLFDFPAADAASHVLIRVAMLTLMCSFAVALSERRGRLYEAVVALEPYVFPIFCSHMLVVIATGVAGNALKINETSAVYPLIFLAQFPMSAITAIGLSVIERRYAPEALALASGKRLRTAQISGSLRTGRGN